MSGPGRSLSAALALGLGLACSAADPAPAPRVLLIGIDGADWEPVEALRRQGRMPHLGSLVEAGASGVLHTVEPMLSPMLWTSIATGRTPPEHGILDFFAADAEGRAVPVPSHRRRVPALWNIVGDLGRRVVFVGWQVTHPAERVEGIMVSDRVLGLVDGASAARPSGIVQPARLAPELAARVVPPEALPGGTLERFFPQGVVPSDPLRRELALVLAQTRTLGTLALHLMSPDLSLLGVYFPGIDEVSHRFARYMPPRLPGVAEREGRDYGRVVEEFYVYQDEVIGELLEAAGPEATVFVVSDHGFQLGRARPRLEPSAKGTPYAPGWHRDNGVILARGPGIRAGLRLRGASIFDVAPTVLARLGLPAGEDMRGRVLLELWESPPDVARIATHDRPGWREAAFAETAAAAEEVRAAEALAARLGALGYLEPGGGAPGRAQAAAEHANLAGYYMQQGLLEPAFEAARRSVDEDPAHYPAWRHLATLYRRSGDPGSALEAIERAIPIREGALEPRLFRVEVMREASGPDAARRAAESLAGSFAADARVHDLLGRLRAETGDLDGAIRSYRASLALDPDRETTRVELLSLWVGRGDAGAIEGWLAEGEADGTGAERRLALARAHLRHRDLENALRELELSLAERPGKEGYLYRGIVLGERGDYARSLLDFERALALDPEYPEAHFNAGVTHLKAGDLAAAVASLEAAAALAPGSGPVWANLGKAYATSGDHGRAREVLERALRLDPGSAMARFYLAQLGSGPAQRAPASAPGP